MAARARAGLAPGTRMRGTVAAVAPPPRQAGSSRAPPAVSPFPREEPATGTESPEGGRESGGRRKYFNGIKVARFQYRELREGWFKKVRI